MGKPKLISRGKFEIKLLEEIQGRGVTATTQELNEFFSEYRIVDEDTVVKQPIDGWQVLQRLKELGFVEPVTKTLLPFEDSLEAEGCNKNCQHDWRITAAGLYLLDQRRPKKVDRASRVTEPTIREQRLLEKIRRGQEKFRQSLWERHRKCQISGCPVKGALEAAHIQPYEDGGSNTLDNGLLLRADLHSLFDRHLITIDPDTLTILVAPELVGTRYDKYAGRKLKTKASEINVENLRNRYNEATRSGNAFSGVATNTVSSIPVCEESNGREAGEGLGREAKVSSC